MQETELYGKIESIVATVLGRDNIVLNRKSTAETVQGWDSLSHIQIVVALEREFQIRFSAAELIDFQNIGALADGIQHKLAEKNS